MGAKFIEVQWVWEISRQSMYAVGGDSLRRAGLWMRKLMAATFVLAGFGLLAPSASAIAAEGTIRFALTTLPPRMGNPYATSAMPSITTTSALYEGLTRITPEGVLKPWLATSWSNVDPKTWRFVLRKGVSFSNGKPFNAAAVAASVNHMATKARPIDGLVRSDLPPLESARVVDEFTVDIVTKNPVPTFPRYATVVFIPEPEAFAMLGPDEFAKTPVGTGPFKLDQWEPNKATFSAFTGSWRKPKSAKLEILELPDATSRVQALISGRVDIAGGLGPEDLQALEAAGHKGVSWFDGGVNGIALVNTRQLPFNDVRVRQALNYAVNRQPIIDVILQGKTVAANQPAARMTYGYVADLPHYSYNPTKAKQLLTEAGYPNGFKFVMETSVTSNTSMSAYQQVASDLAKVGVEMEIRTVQGPQYLQNIFITGNYADALIVPWQSAPTIDVMRAVNIHSCNTLKAWYCDREIMPAITAAFAEWDEAQGLNYRHQIGRHYHAQAASLFLYEMVYFAGVSKNTTGFADHFGFVTYEDIVVTPN
jgi:peptide/nickel transport system substrate-binding protein